MNSKKRYRALVLGSDNRSFLAVIRSLGRKNIDVYIAWCEPKLAARYSRYVKKYLPIPYFSFDNDNWLKKIIFWLKEKSIDIVIPCDDRTLLPIMKHSKVLEKFSLLAIPPEETTAILFDKYNADTLARGLQIPVPAEYLITDFQPEKLKKIINEFGFPLVLKPRKPFNLHSGFKNFVHKAYSYDELEFYLKSMLNNGPVIIQKNFTGTGVGVEILAHNGAILYAFQHIRIHEPPMGGGSSYRKSAPLNPELLHATQKFIKALGYTGVAMLEYKYNFSTGDWRFMEINGRFWGSLPLAVTAGADFPYYLFEMLMHNKFTFPQKYRLNIFCRNWVSDITWLLTNLKSNKTSRRIFHSAIKLIKKIISLKERSDTFVLDDPIPAVVELIQFFRNIFLTKFIKLKIKILTFPIFRKKIAAKIKLAFKNARHILFVCRGNVCRSPFAELYARKIWGTAKTFQSAGYYPEINRVTPAAGLAAAEKFGVDLKPHRSKIISNDMVEKADIIFVFDINNYAELVKRFPKSKNKIFILGFVCDHKEPIIHDPYGKNLKVFISVYTRIAEFVSCLSDT